MPTPHLRLHQVSLNSPRGGEPLLQDISFEVMPGERVAIVGPSGAGKTTLLRVLNRLSEISRGEIYFGDRNIQQIPVIELRQHITLVPQESKLLGMTVRQALEYPLHLRKLSSQAIQQRLLTWTEQLHLPEDWLGRNELQLSVGQRQWVAIARALMIQPKILLLDEPTSALDAGRGEHLLTVLTNVAQNQEMTILMVNHQLEMAEQFASRVLYLQDGKLILDRPIHQINWVDLKQNLVDAETIAANEWE
ncbi:ABC transporter ATP-binding protein [Egbenema bharatensis]|uniref:ABC transporter ATP-binding protein n=1 Tax=Egbenema bharatensis TaxID=3463334 RepID=UPI003A8C600E